MLRVRRAKISTQNALSEPRSDNPSIKVGKLRGRGN
jgi:hypothetical protein